MKNSIKLSIFLFFWIRNLIYLIIYYDLWIF